MLVRLTAAHRYEAEGLANLVAYVLDQQLDDGGWNCAARGEPRKHSSFHTSIQALEALYAYQQAGGEANEERRRLEVGSSFCGIGCTSLIAQVRWRSVGAHASLSCPSGILTCYADSSTSLTWPRTGTNGSPMP